VCSRLVGAVETYPFGESTVVFKVGGKMFALLGLDEVPGQITLKCDPDYASFLVQQFVDVVPGYHMNKRHWITITLSPLLPPDLVDDLIGDSYDAVLASLPALIRRAIESDAGAN
jgi:predicted DNA-binding protein (MmcQ/YjbR family)